MHVSYDGAANEHVFCRALSPNQPQLLLTTPEALSEICYLVLSRGESQCPKHTRCGHLSSSTASALSSLMFRYWSTLLSVPRIWTSFLSSTVISCSTSVLKKLLRCC